MSKKYIGQINNNNFVFPNNKLAEYDIDIIHDLNENSVSGTTSGFSILYNSGTGNLQCSFTYSWYKNNAEVMIDNEGKLQILSLHIMGPNKMYFKPWICVGFIDDVDTTKVFKTDTQNFIITPQMMGLNSFTGGVYYGEIRFIGKRALFPISASSNVVIATPTPTPTPTIGTPTPTPTGGPTFTPTPTPTPTGLCYCFPIVVTGTTGGEGGGIANLLYNDCYGVQTGRIFTVGPGTYYQCIQVIDSVVQYDPVLTTGIDQSYLTLTYMTGNCRTGYVCSGYDPATTPTPTPTPTATSVGPTNTPTPTPTATSVPPTYTPTPTPTATPTATPVLNNIIMYSGSSVGAACSNLTSATYHYYGSFGIATQLYLPDMSDVVPNGNYFYNDTSLVYVVTDSEGHIASTASCPTPTPTPTPTATSVPPTFTPTPTPTATDVPPTFTPTPTPTATPTFLYQVNIRRGAAGDCSVVPSACSDYYSIGPDYTIYTASGGIGTNGEIAYADALGASIFVGGPGPGYYYSDGVNESRINNVGVITLYVSCNC